MTLTAHSDDGVYGTDVYWTELQVDIFRMVAVVGGLPSVAIFPLGFCWAPFGCASGAARDSRLPCSCQLVCRFSGESQMIAGDDGACGYNFPS